MEFSGSQETKLGAGHVLVQAPSPALNLSFLFGFGRSCLAGLETVQVYFGTADRTRLTLLWMCLWEEEQRAWPGMPSAPIPLPQAHPGPGQNHRLMEFQEGNEIRACFPPHTDPLPSPRPLQAVEPRTGAASWWIPTSVPWATPHRGLWLLVQLSG